MLLGVTGEEFLKLDKAKQKTFRQSSKAVNFGRPGGLGDATFVVYARAQYGVTFTKKEAKEAKNKWMALYPETKLYLSDPTELAMRWQTDRQVAPKMGYLQRKRLSEYLKMSDQERAATKYADGELDRFWDILGWIAKYKDDPELTQDVLERKVTGRVRNLTTYRACTLTGRVRNNVNFTSGANTPFQSAAADGAKAALWNLMRRGIHVLGFVHDAVEVAVPEGREKSVEAVVKRVMIDSMQSVLGQNVPVSVDGAMAENWSKA
jgi:DNA polymerase I-like protein with 3'-5' exonuclease and polymerase domains